MGCVCMCVKYMRLSMCDCYLKFWHPSLILGVVKCTVNERKRDSPPLLPPCLFLSLRPRREFHPLSGVTEWHHCVYVRGGECVGIEAFVLSRPPNLTLSAPLLFWVRQKSSLFWDLCPELSTDWTSHIHPSQSEEDSATGPGFEVWSRRGLFGYLALGLMQFFMWQGLNLISLCCRIYLNRSSVFCTPDVCYEVIYVFFPSYLVYHVSRLRALSEFWSTKQKASCSRSNSPSAETKEVLLACTSHAQIPMAHCS